MTSGLPAVRCDMTCTFFDDLSVGSLYALLRLRSEVFVVEQDCVYQDMDDADLSAYHCLALSGDAIVGVSRLLPPDMQGCMSIGRVVVASSHRSMGLGRMLMIYSEDQSRRLWPDARLIHLSAQVYIRGFYESLGYRAIGDSYLEDGIPHIAMEKRL